MNGAARFFWVSAVSAAFCFVALVILSKGSLEPGGMAIFDSRVGGYTPQDALAYLNALTEAQKQAYLTTFRQLDTVFPVLLTATLLGTIWLNTKDEPRQRRLQACAVPLFYLVLDLLENGAVADLLRLEGPEGVAGFAVKVEQASIYTQAKWMTLLISMMVVFWAWRFAAKEPHA